MRSLQTSDLAAMMRLKNAAGWNQTETDLRRNLLLEPGGNFGVDCQGQLAAMANVIRFGHDLAWIGMVLTLPEFRGRGFARSLTERCLEYAAMQGIACAMLDASPMGEPIYRQLGFEPVCVVERWALERTPPKQITPCVQRLDLSADASSFGANRDRLLQLLGDSFSLKMADQQYAMGRPGSEAAYFGPMLAAHVEHAAAAVRAFLESNLQASVYWDLFPGNTNAARLADAFGFRPLRRLLRMRKGRPIDADYSRMYAIAGFEYG